MRRYDAQHVDEGVPVQSVLGRCCVDFAPAPAGTAVPLQVSVEYVVRHFSVKFRTGREDNSGIHRKKCQGNEQGG